MELNGFESYTFFPGQHWSHTWERQHEIITRFAKYLYPQIINICSPLGLLNHNPFNKSFWSRIRNYRKHQALSDSQNPMMDNMHFINAPHIPFHSKCIGLLNYNLMKSQMGISENNFFWSTYMNPTVYEFFRRSKFKVYDLAERRSTNPHLNKTILSWENQAVREANVVFVDNHATYNDYKDLNPNIYYIPQGVNCDSFYPIETPPEEKKYIGYIGNLHFAIDYDFLKALITSNPEEQFLFIGGILENKGYEIINLPNVTYVNQIPKDELNKYLAQMKVGLIPYIVNDHTVGVYPTKLFEYLSAGVPVISTPLPEVQQYANDDYLKIIDAPTSINGFKFPMKETDKLVSNNTWDVRWSEYIKIIKSCLQ